MVLVLLNQSLDATNLISTIPTAVLQSDGLEPELGNIAVTFNMGMRRLVAVACVNDAVRAKAATSDKARSSGDSGTAAWSKATLLMYDER
jgi:hypothetical protein